MFYTAFIFRLFGLSKISFQGERLIFSFTPIREGRYRLRDSEFSGTYFAANQTNVVVESEAAFQQWLTTAAASPAEPAENAASKEFTAAQNSGRFRWKTVKPAPAPTVNYTSSEKDSYE